MEKDERARPLAKMLNDGEVILNLRSPPLWRDLGSDDRVDAMSHAYRGVDRSVRSVERYHNKEYRLRHSECGGALLPMITHPANVMSQFCSKCLKEYTRTTALMCYVGFALPDKPENPPGRCDDRNIRWAQTKDMISAQIQREWCRLDTYYGPNKLIDAVISPIGWPLVFSWNLFCVTSYVHGVETNRGPVMEFVPYWEFMQHRMDQWLELHGG